MALRGIGQSGEDVPGCGDEQKGFKRGERMQLAQTMQRVLEATREHQIDQHNRDGEDCADESLGQHVERAGDSEETAVEAECAVGGCVVRCAADFFGAPEGIKREREPQADTCIRQREAREEKQAEAGEQNEHGVKTGSRRAQHAAGKHFGDPHQTEDIERNGKPRGCGESSRRRGTEEHDDLHARSHRPIHQRGFFEVPDSIRVERDVVVAEQHLAGDLSMQGVCVVEQRRREQREAAVERYPKHEHGKQRGARAGGGIHARTVYGSGDAVNCAGCQR